MLSKSLIQFPAEGWGCVPSLLFDLRPNSCEGNENNDDLLQNVPYMHCYTECPQPCSRPLLTLASARDTLTLMGKSGSVSCGVTGVAAAWCWSDFEEIPHTQGQRRSPQQDGRRGKFTFRIKPNTHQRCLEGSNISCLRTQRPHKD